MFLCKSRSSRCFSWCIFLVCRDCTGVLSGDKSSVTVLGHGTGAACLHYLMTSDALPHGKYNWDQSPQSNSPTTKIRFTFLSPFEIFLFRWGFGAWQDHRVPCYPPLSSHQLQSAPTGPALFSAHLLANVYHSQPPSPSQLKTKFSNFSVKNNFPPFFPSWPSLSKIRINYNKAEMPSNLPWVVWEYFVKIRPQNLNIMAFKQSNSSENPFKFWAIVEEFFIW